ncbi:MAG: hypothetical protein E6356_14160 [Terrisporobacter othiniensis]|nr:hypothetical protein [Terrisporobacter othiniensis]
MIDLAGGKIMVDLYDYKFTYKFKKYEKVTYNKLIFNKPPYPFNVNKNRIALEPKGDFIGIDGGK